MNLEDAFEDITALLGQAIGVFDKYGDLTCDQWGAMQQLYMARALLDAAHSSLLPMALVDRDEGAT